VRRKALPYHPTSSSEWNLSVIFGMAVAMIVRSCVGQNKESLRNWSKQYVPGQPGKQKDR
jgi:hypothetical protein